MTTTWDYDSFGRKIAEQRADGTSTAITYTLCESSCTFGAPLVVTKQDDGSAPSTVYFDALGREVMSQTTGFDGRTIYKKTEYDQYGRVARVSRPYFSGESQYWTSYEYDVLGRMTYETNPDGSYTDVAYAGLTKTTTNDQAQSYVEIKDSQGQVAQVTDADNNTSHYTYDAFGNLVQTTDAAGNVTTMSYDLRGRKVAMNDPDMGQWSYRYDALGQLVWQRDAKGQVVTMAYDKLGRMVQRSEAEGLSQWVYDTKPKGVGRLALVSSPGGYQREQLYDSLGRPTSTTTTVAGSVYTQSVAYDSFSRVQTRTDPTGFAVKNVYNSGGFLAEIHNAANDQLYWQADYVDASGNIGEETLGNGLSTIRTFDPDSGRLTAIVTGGTGQVQLLSYQYDTLGNLRQRRDDNQGLTENFGYDNLNRLVSATVVGGSTKTYQYDAIGNIKSKSDMGAYTYGQDGAGPHAVSQAGTTTYAYDANGNQVSGDGRQIVYTSFNKPAQVTKGNAANDYQYDAGHNRVVKTSTKDGQITITHYLGKAYERVQKPSGVIEHKHYISAGGTTILYTERSNAANDTRYLHKDHLGSTDVITDEQGQVVERLSFDSWGARRNSNWTSAWDFGFSIVSTVSRGFTGHDQDDAVGLINMNARLYDPKLGRFLQPDTFVQHPYTTQGMNRYTYVNNNPLSFTDPTGHFLKFLWRQAKKVTSAVLSSLGSDSPKTHLMNLHSVFKATDPGAMTLYSKPVKNYILTHQWAQATGQIAASYFGGPWGAAGWSAYLTEISGGSPGAMLRAGISSYAMAYVSTESSKGVRDWYSGAGKAYAVVPDNSVIGYRIIPTDKIVGQKLFVNGIMNDLQQAAANGWKQAGGEAFTLFHNPTTGLLADITESGLGKLSGSSLSVQLADMIKSSSDLKLIVLHSQGAIIGTNAVGMLEAGRLAGVSIHFNGAAVNRLVATSVVERSGAAMSWTAHWNDFVPQVIGLNGNPIEMVGSTISTPLLFGGSGVSPHAYP